MVIACVYKPPKGNLENCLKILNSLSEFCQRGNFEIWFLGDFNTDFLRRNDVDTAQLIRFIKNKGLSQLINGITHPNRKCGSCIDLIMTNSMYVLESGILNDFVSDHYSIFCVRKKKKESNVNVERTVRDYRNFDRNWEDFDNTVDTDIQWVIIQQAVTDILAVMCPYKKVVTRTKTTPWLTPEIYRAIRKKQF